MKNYHFTNIRIIDALQDRVGDVFLSSGVIDEEGKEKDYQIIDGKGKILFPGFIDPHVHFREPGFTHKEDISTGSRAALCSGVTGFFDMPNTNPPTFTTDLLEKKKIIAQETSMVHFGFYFGAGPENQEEIAKVEQVPGTKLYLNTTTGNLKMDEIDRWKEIFALGKKVALHAEGETFEKAVSVWSELNMPCPLHLCHASLKSEVDLVRELKTKTDKISMEVCPHHLFMTHKEREKYGAFCCMKPELATQKDIDALWEGVGDGTIDFFATDHAPHTREEKNAEAICYGIPGVETFFPLLFTAFCERGLSLKLFSAMMTRRVIELFGIQNQKGLIKEGYDGDLVVIDPEKEWIIDEQKFYSKCDWTPFHNYKVKGKVQSTWVNGNLVFENEKLIDTSFRGEAFRFGV